MKPLTALGEVLRTARVDAQLSVLYVADRMGVAESSLREYERGARVPRGDVLLALCRLYKLDAAALPCG